MSSGAGPSRRPISELFPRAALRIISSKGEKKACEVVLAVSHRIYWKAVKGAGVVEAKSLFDFKNASSLQLTRLDAAATWKNVEERAKPENTRGSAVIVQGLLRGRARWAAFNANVKLELTAADEGQRDKWVQEIRLRIAPWELLHRRARELMEYVSEQMSVDELSGRMDALLVGEVGRHRVVDISGALEPSQTVQGAQSGASMFQERIQKWDWVEKLNLHFSNLTGIAAKVIGKCAKGGDISNTATVVEDFAKIIPGGASSVFHLVVLSARLVSMYAEASLGREELPVFLVKVSELLQCVTESVLPVLQSSPSAEKGELVLEGSVFEVLVTIFDLMGNVEEQLLRSWQGQLFNSGVVEEIESKLDALKVKAVSVLQTKKIRKIEREMSDVKKKVELPTLPGLLPSRPRKSAYFVGRTNELRQLEEIVREHGTAAITGYGGLGKTQLMTAFAGGAEAAGDVPGGVFWVRADGDATQVVEALAVFVETLKGAAIPDKERRKAEVVVARLKDVLSQISGR